MTFSLVTERRTNSATVTAPGWRPWTGAEEKRLLAAKARGALKAELIAEFPGRTWVAIKRRRTKVGNIGVPLSALRKRERAVYPEACPMFRMFTARRRAIGMTRGDLAAKLGIGRTTVEHWEYGKAYPCWDRLLKWADLLGMMIVAREKSSA